MILALVALLIGELTGYFVGRKHSDMLHRLEVLAELKANPKEKPTITMGELEPPKAYFSPEEKRKVGLVETKTPQQVEWEAEQKTEKEGRGIGIRT